VTERARSGVGSAVLFSVSLLPLSTAWMAVSRLSPQPVAFYAGVFFLVNVTYVLLIWDLVDQAPAVRKTMRARSIVTLCLFGVAAVAALTYPLVGLGICCCCLIVYLHPEAPMPPTIRTPAAPGWLKHLRGR
jgi:uncharacterized membrane protein